MPSRTASRSVSSFPPRSSSPSRAAGEVVGDPPVLLVTTIPREGVDRLLITSPDGEPIGDVTIPPLNEESLLTIKLVPEVLQPHGSGQPVTLVLDVVVTGPDGDVTEFGMEPVRLCFRGVDTVNDRCLGFVNADDQWECEDYCLDTDGQEGICGNSDHLTNFAVLLDSRGGSNSRCGSSSQDWRLVWASAALVCVAMLVVLAAVLVIEIRLRFNVSVDETRLTRTFVQSPAVANAAAEADAIANATIPLFYPDE